MTLSYNMVNSRPKKAGWCLVCPPIEHFSLSQFEELIDELTGHECFIAGDKLLNKENACGHLLDEIPPVERSDAFVDVAVLLVFNQSGSNEKGLYFFQPKAIPISGRTYAKQW